MHFHLNSRALFLFFAFCCFCASAPAQEAHWDPRAVVTVYHADLEKPLVVKDTYLNFCVLKLNRSIPNEIQSFDRKPILYQRAIDSPPYRVIGIHPITLAKAELRQVEQFALVVRELYARGSSCLDYSGCDALFIQGDTVEEYSSPNRSSDELLSGTSAPSLDGFIEMLEYQKCTNSNCGGLNRVLQIWHYGHGGPLGIDSVTKNPALAKAKYRDAGYTKEESDYLVKELGSTWHAAMVDRWKRVFSGAGEFIHLSSEAKGKPDDLHAALYRYLEGQGLKKNEWMERLIEMQAIRAAEAVNRGVAVLDFHSNIPLISDDVSGVSAELYENRIQLSPKRTKLKRSARLHNDLYDFAARSCQFEVTFPIESPQEDTFCKWVNAYPQRGLAEKETYSRKLPLATIVKTLLAVPHEYFAAGIVENSLKGREKDFQKLIDDNRHAPRRLFALYELGLAGGVLPEKETLEAMDELLVELFLDSDKRKDASKICSLRQARAFSPKKLPKIAGEITRKQDWPLHRLIAAECINQLLHRPESISVFDNFSKRTANERLEIYRLLGPVTRRMGLQHDKKSVTELITTLKLDIKNTADPTLAIQAVLFAPTIFRSEFFENQASFLRFCETTFDSGKPDMETFDWHNAGNEPGRWARMSRYYCLEEAKDPALALKLVSAVATSENPIDQNSALTHLAHLNRTSEFVPTDRQIRDMANGLLKINEATPTVGYFEQDNVFNLTMLLFQVEPTSEIVKLRRKLAKALLEEFMKNKVSAKTKAEFLWSLSEALPSNLSKGDAVYLFDQFMVLLDQTNPASPVYRRIVGNIETVLDGLIALNELPKDFFSEPRMTKTLKYALRQSSYGNQASRDVLKIMSKNSKVIARLKSELKKTTEPIIQNEILRLID